LGLAETGAEAADAEVGQEHGGDGGLTTPSVIMCDQARAQSVLRFLRRRGSVSRAVVEQVQALVGECIDR
jgi:mRNA-degrading endonuclease toxin of MazEF toxin-antitoxin module